MYTTEQDFLNRLPHMARIIKSQKHSLRRVPTDELVNMGYVKLRSWKVQGMNNTLIQFLDKRCRQAIMSGVSDMFKFARIRGEGDISLSFLNKSLDSEKFKDYTANIKDDRPDLLQNTTAAEWIEVIDSAGLTPNQRKVFLLTADGYDCQEIATREGMGTRQNVSEILQRARKNIKRYIKYHVN